MRLPGQPDSRLALAWLLCLFVVLLLLMAAPRGHGQTESPSGPLSLTQLLEACEQNLQTLNSRLAERQLQVQTLRESLQRAEESLTASLASLMDLREKLAGAESSLVTLQRDLQETQNLYSALSTQYDALETSWQAYRNTMVTQVAGLERDVVRARRWAAVFGVGTAVGFIVSVVLALR